MKLVLTLAAVSLCAGLAMSALAGSTSVSDTSAGTTGDATTVTSGTSTTTGGTATNTTGTTGSTTTATSGTSTIGGTTTKQDYCSKTYREKCANNKDTTGQYSAKECVKNLAECHRSQVKENIEKYKTDVGHTGSTSGSSSY